MSVLLKWEGMYLCRDLWCKRSGCYSTRERKARGERKNDYIRYCIKIDSSTESVSELCDCLHVVIMLGHIVVFSFTRKNKKEIESRDPEMEICFPACNCIPLVADSCNNADERLDMSR